MKKAADIADIASKKISNHSVRKTAVKRLLDNGCPPSYVVQLTGHKSESSLASYTETCSQVQKKMAKTLSDQTPFQQPTVPPAGVTEKAGGTTAAASSSSIAATHSTTAA